MYICIVNYRKYDIIEFKHKDKLVTAKIIGFSKIKGKLTAEVIIHGTTRKPSGGNSRWWVSCSYPTVNILVEDIIRVVKRKRGNKCKKKYTINLDGE